MSTIDEVVAALPAYDRFHIKVPVHVDGFADGWFDAIVMRTADGIIQVAVTFDWMAISAKGATYSDAYANFIDAVTESYRQGDFDTPPEMMTEAEIFAAAFAPPDFDEREDFAIEPNDLNPVTSFLDSGDLFLA